MEQPLAGVRILSLEQAAALPFATRHLADLGAEVIRVQSHLRTPKYVDPANIDLIRSKRQLGLDLAAEGGPELFLRLAEKSDVVAHNFTPRVVRRFGIDYEGVRRVNPDIIYLSLTGFGTTGPWGERPLFGPGAEAISGHDLLVGTPDKWPGRPGTIVYADNTCGLYSVFAILAALEQRDRGGGGRFIDISLYETAVSHLGPVLAERSLGANPERCGNDDRRFEIHGVFEAKGHDRQVAIAAKPHETSALATALGIAKVDSTAVAEAVREREAEDVAGALQRAGVAASVVADASDVLRDEQFRARGYYATIPRDIGHGRRRFPHAGPAWGGGSALRFEEPGSAGCDSEGVLREVLGATPEETARLFERGVVGRAEPAPPPPRAPDAVRISRGEVSRADPNPAWDAAGSDADAAPAAPVLGPAPGMPPARIGIPGGERRPRALDVSARIAPAFAARLLADAGWDVVRADLPGTSRMDRAESRWGGGAGGAFGAISAGKRTIRLNNVNTLPEIAAAADVVIGDFSSGGRTAAGLPDEVFPRLSPRLATVSVSPHGLTGPRAESPAAELTMQAASGLMFLTGEYDQPPMQLPPYQAELTGGVAAACAAVAAARLARHTGVRQQADVSIVEALSSHIYQATAAYSYRGTVIRREARVKAGLRMVPASDGFVYCAAGALATQRMDGLAKLIDEPRLNDERFATAEGRMENYDELVALFVPPFRERTAKEWFEAAEALHLTFALVQTVDDLFECPQLSARGLLRDETAPDGRRIKVPGRPFITTSTGPSPGDERPASGVETVDTLDWLDDGAEEGAE